MKKGRVFVAINLPDELRCIIAKYIESLKKGFSDSIVRWEKVEKLHLTLKFLGEIDPEEVEELKKIVTKIVKFFQPFDLEITGTGIFGPKSSPRVLWLGVRDCSGSLSELQRRLEVECRKAGFRGEDREFRAHLTIGRIRDPLKSFKVVERHLSRNFEARSFKVLEIAVYESLLSKEGSKYFLISSHKLGYSS